LSRLGAEVVVPREQGCCGSLALHQGERETGMRQARALVGVFAGTGVDIIASTAAGCGSMMKEYGQLFPDGSGTEFASKVRDISEVLAQLAGEIPPTRPLPLRVGYHEACHLRNAQRLSLPPRELLRAVPGLELVEIPGQEFCCGSAGVYNLLQPVLSDELKRRKVAAVLEAKVDLVVTANPGCLLQMGSGLKGVEGAPPVVHLAEVLAYAWGLSVKLPI
jgi:glycolate oxidase iron-sulfur subunit